MSCKVGEVESFVRCDLYNRCVWARKSIHRGDDRVAGRRKMELECGENEGLDIRILVVDVSIEMGRGALEYAL